jgi:TolA-binding protein
MNGMLLLAIGLIALVGALCTIIYTDQASASRSAKRRQEQLNRIEQRIHELSEVQKLMQKRIEQLSTDVLQREIYQSANDRHQMAIKDAKAGRSLDELMLRHGLSSDEAALIVALHANTVNSAEDVSGNANIGLSLSADLS